jgi:hypothetical protein
MARLVSASSVWSDRHNWKWVGWFVRRLARLFELTLLWIAARHWVDCA